MVEIILLILLVGLSLFLSRLRTVYTSIPASELSHRSREGDKTARQLHLVAKYGASISVVFWTLILLATAGGILISTQVIAGIWAYLLSIVLLFAVFIFIPNTRSSRICSKIAIKLAPQIATILSHTLPITKMVNRVSGRLMPKQGVKLSLEEVAAFFKDQKETSKPLLTQQQTEAIVSILKSDNKRIKDVMLPFESIRIVKDNEAIGPILIDELHKTNQGWFPVRPAKKKNIIGFFYIHDLLAHAEGGKISDVMDEELFYIHEKQPLWAILDAFIQTKSQIYLVIDETQKIVGIVSVECVLVKLLGNLESAGSESYDDPETVALY